MKKFIIMALFVATVAVFVACGGEQAVTDVGVQPEATHEPLSVQEAEIENYYIADTLIYEDDNCWLIERPQGLVYSLSTDVHIQALRAGTINTETIFYTPYLMPVGTATIIVLDGIEGNNAIGVGARRGERDAIKLETSGLNLSLDSEEYTITVRGNVMTILPTQIMITGADYPYTQLVSLETGDNFILEATISNTIFAEREIDPDQFKRGFVIRTTNTASFTIYEITVTNGATGATHANPDLFPPAIPALDVIQPPPVTDTVSQANAVRMARNYINFRGFSRSGLIAQLEFEGFSNADATYGADNIGADWYAQAVRAAQAYLDFTAFSRSGLINQLVFDGFTRSQATHGVDATGL